MKTEKSQLEVHLNRLEEDAAEQPQLLFLWGQASAKATKKAKESVANLKLLQAQVSMECRQDPKGFGLEKATEDSVKAAVTLDPRIVEASQQVIEAEYDAEVINQYFWALKDRSNQIENAIKLHGQMYFSVDTRRLGEVETQKRSVPQPTDRDGRKK